MRLLIAAHRRSFSDFVLVVKLIVLLTTIRAAISLLPFSTLRKLIVRRPRTCRPAGLPRQRKVLALLQLVGRDLLRPRPCLPQALAGVWLLKRWGVESELRIGVAREETGSIGAHAWVERDGEIVVGKIPTLTDYTVLTPAATETDIDRAAKAMAPKSGPTAR